ncbi:MAG: aminodeoxychorismate/anthranilate synthase component II [Alphaproteobacteria bacterium]|nr:aminodeoxychorismate/anthranilate synthase component II [Alphaproteobacteria bacterium]MCB9697787.1 aminodeoxychorismate/anthranilate synthase component II [Alphaproteobacteria bacterium]
MRLLLVDAWDSFTHNLVHALIEAGAAVDVVRCDEIDEHGVVGSGADGVVLGPGPGGPLDAGCFVPAVPLLVAAGVPTLGVCLGQQAIGLALGGRVVRHHPVHGSATAVHHDGRGLFADVPAAAPMTRYHSLVVDADTLPACLRPTAWSEDGALMGLAHVSAPVHAVQFHPESVLSGAAGQRLLRNFTRLVDARSRRAA